MALRSPLVQEVMSRRSAYPPVWALVVRVQVEVLVPNPARYQQSGTSFWSPSASKPGLGSRFCGGATPRSSKVAVPVLARLRPMLSAVAPVGIGGGVQWAWVQVVEAGVKALLAQNVQVPLVSLV